MSEKEFKIRTYGKTELAMMYAPELTESGAWKRLKQWFRVNPRLRCMLRVPGHTFTPRQVRKIVEEVGEPD